MATVTERIDPIVPRPRLGRRQRVLLPLAGIALVASLVAWLYAHGSYFSYDDLKLFAGFRHGGGLDLLASNGGHLNPGYSVLHKIAYLGWKPRWGLSLDLMIACHAASTVLLQRILSRVYGDAWWTFALALGFGVSIINLSLLVDFTYSSTYVPALTFSLAAIHAHLAWLQGGGRGWLAWSVIAVGLGLLFYEAVVLVPITLVLMWVFVLEPELSVRDSARAAARAWRVWALYAIPIVIFAILLEAGDYAKRSVPGIDPVLEFLRTAWERGFSGGIFGIFVGIGPTTTLEDVGLICAQLAIVALVVWSIKRRFAAWRAWAFFAIAFSLGVLLISPRLNDFGPSIGGNLRYVAQATYLFPLALAFAFARPKGGGAPAAPASRPRVVRVAGFAAVAATIATLSVFGALASRREAIGPKVGAWIGNVRHDVAAVRARGQEPSILDAKAPAFVVPGYVQLGPNRPDYPETISDVTAVFAPGLRRGLRFDPARSPLFTVRDSGRLQPVGFVAASDEPLLAAVGAKRAVPGPGRLEREGRLTCMTAGPLGGGMIEYQPPHVLRESGSDWYLSAEVRSTASLLGIFADRGIGYPISPDRLLPSGAGRPGNVSVVEIGGLPTGVPTFARMRIFVPKGTKACFGRIRIGSFAPAS